MTADKEKKYLDLAMANRHGLIAGATGTGKTVTLQTIAEQFSRAGVCIFLADVKGDLSGLAASGLNDSKIIEARKRFSDAPATGQASPTIFWDMYSQKGQPLRTTIRKMGPLLLGRLLNVNNTQQGIITAAFSIAEDQNLLLLDLKDFSALISWMSDNAETLREKYGNISKNSIGAIQREILSLEEAGGDKFFGEPALELKDFIQKNSEGHGYINILDATKLINDSKLYSTFLLWLLTELFDQLPELGDVKIPKLVFFFDEAHLLFSSCPQILLEKLEQVVRLIRSKGVGVYFVTQNPLDVSESILGQLSNRIQHGLRAFTPKDQKAVKAAAETFRQNPELDTSEAITELSVGEALVSFLDEQGKPSMVEKVNVMPPLSKIGAISDQERDSVMKQSPSYGSYESQTKRESAQDVIANRRAEEQAAESDEQEVEPKQQGRTKKSETNTQVFLKSTAKILNSRVAQQVVRGILKSIFGNKK